MSAFAAPRVVVTGHSADGTSIITSDSTITPFQPFGPSAAAFTIMHRSATIPASNTAPLTPSPPSLPRCPPAGALLCTADYPPNCAVPLHRTESLDYAVVLAGAITLTLDGGESVDVAAGEFIVQRGVNHVWTNKSADRWCRVLFVMLGAEKVVLRDGTVLEETVLPLQK